MPQKNAKKAKDKSKKPAKAVTKHVKAAGISEVVKKTAKNVATKVKQTLVKKAPIAAKKAAPAKVEKPLKKAAVEKKAVVAAPLKKKAAVVPVPLAKDKKAAAKEIAAPVKPEKGAKAKAIDVVVEVSSKVTTVIVQGKKKAKSASDSSGSSGKKRCREPGCEHDPAINGYCRLHYIKNWRKVKRKEAILASGQLNNYVEELVNKYPDKYLEVIRQDLASEKEWGKVVVDLELDATDDDAGGDEEVDAVAEGGVRPAARGEFDDDSDSF